MDDDPLEGLAQALVQDEQLLIELTRSFNRLLELVDEVGRRHHELYMAWAAAIADPNERTAASPGFIPRFVKK